MRILYYLGTDYCGACGFVKKQVLRLKEEFPKQVVIVDTNRYVGDLKRIDQRKVVDKVPCCVVEDDGREVARITGHTCSERLKRLLLGEQPL